MSWAWLQFLGAVGASPLQLQPQPRRSLGSVPPQLYQPLRLRVALIGLEVWNHRDKITVSPNPEVTLDNFLHWRESELLRKKPHDNAQLIT